ncbi:phage terminase small subunit [Lactiplantibacillus plantarum]|uniref:terminase small subunit n=1 Tax=Lactiplantibacillus plantarum TaxID=1590 RepID=UPI000FDB76C0|nr:terminase small subunit [Lactiplantibacillus plantarum]MDN7045579.1 terminase small subunit [Lactiplantibacillus plantarum]MDN7064234.1 terminase small subunit [Lactiplantibacillus plantarum]MDN7070045.1 terminase small subunit [Lactiplantibacillus plantarum]GCD87448.1 phage terminase small subunit [Lactiplantibacillus plantarum]
MKRKLTPKQQKFADEYIKSGNAYQAAIEAGYSRNYAKAQSSKLLENVGIKSYIDEQMNEIASKRIMDATEAVELLTSIARGETKETVYIGTADGVYEKHKEADLKTRISATKEILKRYPDNDKLVEQQIRKLKADADIAEAKASIMNASTDSTEAKVSEYLDKLDDVLGGDSDGN